MQDLCGAIQKFEHPESKPTTFAIRGSPLILLTSADILNAAHPVGRLRGSESPRSFCRANELIPFLGQSSRVLGTKGVRTISGNNNVSFQSFPVMKFYYALADVVIDHSTVKLYLCTPLQCMCV